VSSLLVLGGARSGKSSFAQARAEALAGELVYIATAQAFDDEMVERIALHRSDRGVRWSTVEAPIELAAAIECYCAPGAVVLVDCLTLWVSNLMLGEHDMAGAAERLVGAMMRAAGPVIFVSNEVGLGIVPDNALARRFRDEAGRLNQLIAKGADEVVFIAAGLPLRLK
jgi:adenosylcobinamide kinase/adenosylcobinamide-phosphate guanylyltransferase